MSRSLGKLAESRLWEAGKRKRFVKRSRFVRVSPAARVDQISVFLKIGSGMARITAITIRQIGRT